MQFELIPDRDQHKYEDSMVRDLLKVGWMPDVEYVARYEAVAATGTPLDEVIEDTGGNVSVRAEYIGTLYRLHNRQRNVVAWVEGRVAGSQ